MARQTTARRTGRTPANTGAQGDQGGSAVTLDELSPEARAQLLEEAKASIDAAALPTDEEAAGAARNAQLGALMDPRDHLRDCPMDGRYEAYGDRRPAKPDQGVPAEDVTVVRCIECGGTNVLSEAHGPLLARLATEALVGVGEDD
jgi:hypothetical protein